MGKQGKEAKHTVPCTLRNTALAALFSPSLLPKSPSSPLLLRSVPDPQPVVNHKLNVTELVNPPHNQLLHDSPGDFQGGRKQRKRKDEERKETATSCSFALQARHEANQAQAGLNEGCWHSCWPRNTQQCFCQWTRVGRPLPACWLRFPGWRKLRPQKEWIVSSLPVLAGKKKQKTVEKWRAEADSVRLLWANSTPGRLLLHCCCG